ncbi:hypothetical protein Egran_01417 [Elaphomyces granulatus]|uniref:Uncharacterized protein n=1 Tax=Elaphomyces granulatus TaxID=519963 RepID=A0A232M359_9EURO|nr:hypothetical protein Egran_01417 [Elaphomyces granulatus]
MAASLSIVIYKGSPIDASEFRHTALFLEFPEATTLLIHVTGASGFFQAEVRPGEEPTRSKKFIKKIFVGTITGQTKTAIESTIKFTPIDNSDRSWNCQNWVGDALKKLSDRQWITGGAFSKAIDAMVEVIIDAPDEA